MALTKVSGDFIKDGSITQGHLHSSHGITTSHITEGDKLFFTNARVDSRVGSLSTSDLSEGTNLYYTDARADARIAAADTDSLSEGSTNLYYTDARADARVALIVDSAPGTLNTLNELAAALGDDANFSTTVTNSIALKAPLASPTFTGSSHFTGNVEVGSNADISMDSSANGQLMIDGLGYQGAIALDDTAMYIYHNSSGRNLVLGTNETARLTITASGNATFTGTLTASGYNDSNWNTAYGWGDHGAAGYLTSFDITTQTDSKYIRSDADDTASGIITLTKNTATGLANNTFSHAKTIIGGIHFANGNGPAANNGNQAAITFQGGSASEAQAGIYVHNNNSQGTHMLFATTDSYSAGPKAGITLLNNGNVTIRGTVGASNFSGSSSGTNTGDQDLSGYATSATTLAGYGITNAIEKGAQIASGASWTTATKFGSTGDLSQAAGNHALSVRSENNNDAFMSFHIASDYAVHFGLDGATNRMHVGGWSDGTGTQYQLYDSRDFSVASVLNSNVTLASLGALSTSGTAADSSLLDGKDHTQFGATLATYGTTAGSSGRIRCTAPFNTNSAHMFQVTISLYGSYTQHTYIVSAYMYPSTNQWYSPKVIYLGTGSPDIIVGRDANGKAYISIANGNYMGVRVHNMTRGYHTSVADTYDPWTITVDAGTENSVTPSIYKTWTSGNDGSGSGLDADLLDGLHASSFLQSESDTLATVTARGASTSTAVTFAKATFNTSSTGLPRQITIKEDGDTENSMGSYPGAWTSALNIQSNDASTYLWLSPLTSNIPRIQTNYGQLDFYTGNNTNRALHLSGTSARSEIFYDLSDTNTYFNSSEIVLRHSSPQIALRDTDHRSVVLHNNSNRFYVLGAPVDSTSYAQINSVWPWYVQLDTNNVYTGNIGYAGGSYRAPIFYDSNDTGYYANPASTSRFSRIDFGVTNYYIHAGDWGMRNTTPSGWIQLGPANTSHAHIYTDRSNFYFNKQIQLLGGTLINQNDIRAGVFYDVNNTTYYLDPTTSGTSAVLRGNIRIEKGNSTGTAIEINSVRDSTWPFEFTSNDVGNDNPSGFWVGSNGYPDMRLRRDNNIVRALISSWERSFTTFGLTDSTDMRAPIFYDSNNTTYYTRPSTSSNINSLYTAGLIQVGSSGTGNIYIGGTTGNHFRFHTNNSQTYFDMNCGTVNWRQGSSTRYYFYPSTANMTINGTLTQYSDIRYKENIVEIPDAIDKIKSIRGVYYNRTDFNTEPTKIGVIAQEVEVLMPELILQAEDTDLKSVSYNELTAVLVQAIKEQQTIIDDLKSRIETLENQ